MNKNILVLCCALCCALTLSGHCHTCEDGYDADIECKDEDPSFHPLNDLLAFDAEYTKVGRSLSDSLKVQIDPADLEALFDEFRREAKQPSPVTSEPSNIQTLPYDRDDAAVASLFNSIEITQSDLETLSQIQTTLDLILPIIEKGYSISFFSNIIRRDLISLIEIQDRYLPSIFEGCKISNVKSSILENHLGYNIAHVTNALETITTAPEIASESDVDMRELLMRCFCLGNLHQDVGQSLLLMHLDEQNNEDLASVVNRLYTVFATMMFDIFI